AQALGAPVRRGDTLLTIAPQGRHRLLLAVDERDIDEVRPGVAGRLALSALPDEALPCTVERIIPVAVTRDGANRFEIEASLDGVFDGAVTLRAGMQGVAKLDAEKRSLLWQFGHRLFDWARLHLFAWGM
ncbi:MAG: HlyD family secretion protein, partial [Propionivibrio sp.]